LALLGRGAIFLGVLSVVLWQIGSRMMRRVRSVRPLVEQVRKVAINNVAFTWRPGDCGVESKIFQGQKSKKKKVKQGVNVTVVLPWGLAEGRLAGIKLFTY
jgi:hypothetical protein